MIQFKILTGKKAGAAWVARRFPVQIGRSAGAQLRLEDEGIWDRHLELQFDDGSGLVLRTQGEALAMINGAPVREAVLRSGDIIDIGSAKLLFSMSETRQKALAVREVMCWLLVGAVLMSQVVLLYWLLR